jgi:hypothetical protein
VRQRRAVEQLLALDLRIAGLEDDPIGDVRGVVKGDDAREAGVADPEANSYDS